MNVRQLALLIAAIGSPLVAHDGQAQSSDTVHAGARRLSLGFAVDTTITPSSWWGVDPARAAIASVVRAWAEYLAVRADTAKRILYWSGTDRARTPDPDLLAASESYILTANAELVEALPVTASDSSRWLLRTVYISGGSLTQPGLLGMERSYIVREQGRWVLTQASRIETVKWRRTRVGAIEYVVDPSMHFDRKRAERTARWLESTATRFGLPAPTPITYYQVPDLDAAFSVMGLDWALSADRVGGRSNPRARVVFAADPRFGEAYLHELTHVLLAPIAWGKSVFVGEGIAYWLGGARGVPFLGMMHNLATFLDAHPDLTLEAILDSSATPTAASARLPSAAAVFELAFRRGGDRGVIHFIDALGKAEPSASAIAHILTMTPPELDAGWRSVIMSYKVGGGKVRMPRSPNTSRITMH